MKKTLYIFLLFSQLIWAQTPFEKGNEYYQKGKYREAISQYQSILDKRQESAAVYFNLGNCYYKLNQVAPAIYHFEKALLLSPTDSDIKNNLSFAQKMTIDDIQEVPEVGFIRLLSNYTSTFHFDTWATITIISAFFILFFFILYYYSATTFYKRIYFSGMILLLLTTLTCISIAFFEYNRKQNEKIAIVFTDTLQVKSEPNTTAPNAFILHAGTKVFILEGLNNFYKIKLANAKEGWIEKTNIKVVE